MQYTLLEIIQRTLSSIKGEEVNSYDDTAESLVVRDIVKECFYNLIAGQDFPELKTLFELNASGDNNKPTLMTIPSDVLGVEWIKYNKIAVNETADVFDYVHYLPLKDFLERNHALDEDEAEVGSFTVTTGISDSIDFFYRNDRAPMYYTSFDDETVIFDSYDSDVDTTLQKTKTLAYGLKSTTWSDTNNFVLPIDSQQFNILIKDVKAMAWEELRQTNNASAIMQARKARISAEKKKDRMNYKGIGYYYSKYPNYGRK